eukprot:9894641-Alexandrium_andersonii.AAC.1
MPGVCNTARVGNGVHSKRTCAKVSHSTMSVCSACNVAINTQHSVDHPTRAWSAERQVMLP